MGRDKPATRTAAKRDWYCQATLATGRACGKKADDKSELDPTGRLECGDADRHAEGESRSWWATEAPPAEGWNPAPTQASKTTKRAARR